MILTCPECATGYFVDDAQMRPSGRSVKCANCGARWTAYPETPLELTPAPASAPGEADITEAPLTVRAADEVPKAIRAKISTKRQVRRLAISGMIWGGMAAVLAALIGAALILRVDVVKAWPRTATLYSAIGLRVNAVGLVIENQSAEPSLQDGHAALSISGMIRNVEDHTIVSPPLRMTLLNKDGKRVGTYIRRPANPRIPAGGALYFASAIMDPPSSARDLEITFAPDVSGVTALTRPINRPTAAVMTPGLKGSAAPESPAAVIQDAAPLSPGTPNALPAQPTQAAPPASAPHE
jgi:predicted Zn finger-like uncharacterized protein